MANPEVGKHWSYDLLKQIAAQEDVSPGYLEELKEMFASDIDSVRRSECIHSMSDLIDCLERRDVLSERNVEPMRHFPSDRLQEALQNYVIPLHADNLYDPINQYQEQRLAESLRQSLNIGDRVGNDMVFISSHVNGTTVPMTMAGTYTSSMRPVALTERQRNAIYKKLSQEIGNFWRRLGRELDISEGAMDEIELQFPRDLPSRVYKLLHLFEEDGCHDPKKHVQFLCAALDACQRKDLSRKVKEIVNNL